jgi:hypothetical protein
MTSLYRNGWRQGSLFEAELPLDSVTLEADSKLPVRHQSAHGRWVIATQDCDLDQVDSHEADSIIELRPVFIEDPPKDWGIRSARFLLAEDQYVISTSPRTHVSPAVLTALQQQGVTLTQANPARREAFIIWLGKRYDRPAVPDALIPLARRIGELVKAKRNRATGVRVRDVLMQFDDSAVPLRFSLYAVLDDAADENTVRHWLGEIALGISPDLGVADEIEAATAERISLKLIETSYSADVTQLTWRPNSPEPDGAT